VPEVDLAGGRVVIADRPGLVTPLPDDADDVDDVDDARDPGAPG
jgi:16S rRNA processing protein RimM